MDSQNGDDARSGTSIKQAWKTLERVNAHVFQPGDQLLFKAGSRFTGQLQPQSSGAEVDGKDLPIVLGKYGDRPRLRVDGEGLVLDTFLLCNVEFW